MPTGQHIFGEPSSQDAAFIATAGVTTEAAATESMPVVMAIDEVEAQRSASTHTGDVPEDDVGTSAHPAPGVDTNSSDTPPAQVARAAVNPTVAAGLQPGTEPSPTHEAPAPASVLPEANTQERLHSASVPADVDPTSDPSAQLRASPDEAPVQTVLRAASSAVPNSMAKPGQEEPVAPGVAEDQPSIPRAPANGKAQVRPPCLYHLLVYVGMFATPGQVIVARST